MKKIGTILLAAAFIPLLAVSQTLTPTVVASSGGFFTASNGSLSFTVGEMTMVQTFTSANNILTQGFQQPEDLGVGIAEIPVTSSALVTYPNPTSGAFSLQFTGDEETQKEIYIYNSLGQMVKKIAVQQTVGANKIEIDISAFAQGMYVVELQLRNTSGDFVPVFSKLNLLQ